MCRDVYEKLRRLRRLFDGCRRQSLNEEEDAGLDNSAGAETERKSLQGFARGRNGDLGTKITAVGNIIFKSESDLNAERREAEGKMLESALKFAGDAASRVKDSEVYALYELLWSAGPPPEEETPEALALPDDAALYLCWYNQLRDLIDRNPKFAEEYEVCALPAGGFTGDWFVGVASGSASVSLGEKVIEALTSVKEEYRRYAMGVGLPTRRSFYESQGNPNERLDEIKFSPWRFLRGRRDTRRIREIHRNALSRSNLSGYARFRIRLSNVCRQLTMQYPGQKGIAEGDPNLAKFNSILRRLSAQVNLLRSDPD